MVSVEVIVERETIEKWTNSVHVANYVMQELVERGAPVGGALFPTTIERGRIVIETGAFDELIVRWEE